MSWKGSKVWHILSKFTHSQYWDQHQRQQLWTHSFRNLSRKVHLCQRALIHGMTNEGSRTFSPWGNPSPLFDRKRQTPRQTLGWAAEHGLLALLLKSNHCFLWCPKVKASAGGQTEGNWTAQPHGFGAQLERWNWALLPGIFPFTSCGSKM